MKSLLLISFLCCLGNILSAQKPDDRGARPGDKDTSIISHIISQQTMSGLRNSRPAYFPDKNLYLTDPGRQGFLVYDPGDKTTPDDSVMTLVTANGLRFKRNTDNGTINIKWFGATGNGSTDDWYPIQKAINYVLNNNTPGRTLYFPPGNYKIGRPLIIARLQGSSFNQASINLVGPSNSKNIATGFAQIITTFNNTFAIGIQKGKGILIKDLAFSGQFTFPNKLNPIQVDTLSFKEWTDRSSRDNPLSPYSGIVIDPFSDSTVYPNNSDMYPGLHAYCPAGFSRGGSTSIQIVGCSVKNFIVGVMITPSNQQNGELIDVIDCDISSNKVAYAIGQAQSKECHVSRLKCWGTTHTIFDNVSYGFKHGDGAGIPMVDGVNIASAVKQLCRIQAASFGGSFRNVYAEGLFRLGFVGGPATVSFEDCQIDFATQDPGIPYPDFYVLGLGTTFHDCMLRIYPGVPGARLILSGTNNHYDGGTTNAPPITVNLDNNGVYPNPSFSNMNMYYSGGILGSSNRGVIMGASPFRGSNGTGTDPLYPGNTSFFRDASAGVGVTYKFTYGSSYERTIRLSGEPVVHINKSNWTAYFKLAAVTDNHLLKPGDFILTSGLHYQDQFTGTYAPTYPVGIIQRIGHDTVYLQSLAYGIGEGMALHLYMNYFVNEEAPFTGDLAAGSNTIEHVQGVFPPVGSRPDIPMLPAGSYVTAINTAAGTISFSSSNKTRRSFADYTFINGYPMIEMYSSYDPAYLQQYNKTLIGGADFYRYDGADINSREFDYLISGTPIEKYKILNTNIKGDTSLHKLRYLPLSLSNPLNMEKQQHN